MANNKKRVPLRRKDCWAGVVEAHNKLLDLEREVIPGSYAHRRIEEIENDLLGVLCKHGGYEHDIFEDCHGNYEVSIINDDE